MSADQSTELSIPLPTNAEEYRAWFEVTYPGVEYGKCACSPDCGHPTRLAKDQRPKRFLFRGEPLRFAAGHQAPGKTMEHNKRLAIEFYERERRKAGVDWGACFCGCGSKAPISQATDQRSKLIKGHPYRYIYGHRIAMVNRGSVKYIEEDRGYKTPCWIWQLKRNQNGYGHITVGGKTKLAHRHYYELAKSKIPAGLTIDHLCRNRNCVNPDHLEPVPMHINQRRSSKTVLNEELVIALKKARHLGVEYPTLETLTGIKRRTLRAAVIGENWSK